MMERAAYKIADLVLIIHYEKAVCLSELHNYNPFIYNGDISAPLIEVEVTLHDCQPVSLTNYKEIGTFDNGDIQQGVYQQENGDYLFLLYGIDGEICYQIAAKADFSFARIYLQGKTCQQPCSLNNALMLLFAFASAPYQALLIHASVVCSRGRGYLFLGTSGTGKSTHTSLWLQHIAGSALLNDDNPVLRMVDGKAMVYGSPWSGKTPCYLNEQCPVGALVQLKQAPRNHIVRQPIFPAFGILLSSCASMIWDRRLYNIFCDTVTNVVGTTPIYLLECLPDEAAATLSANTIRPEQ